MKKYILTGLLLLGSYSCVFAATDSSASAVKKQPVTKTQKSVVAKTDSAQPAASKTTSRRKARVDQNRETLSASKVRKAAVAKTPTVTSKAVVAKKSHRRIKSPVVAATSAATAVATAATTQPATSQASEDNSTAADRSTPVADTRELRLASTHAMIVDANSGQALYSKSPGDQVPIASVTKLMTAMVVLDSQQSLDDTLRISEEDVDHFKNSSSRLRVNTAMSRHDMLHLALMSSENRAASALSRHYPGGKKAFVAAMQRKAVSLGMTHTRFVDPTGLYPSNQSTAEDLVKMVRAAYTYPLIRQFTTTANREMKFEHQPVLAYKNTNALVRGGEWDILVSKTGFTQEAGHCLVMMANVAQRPTVMVFLESQGKLSPVGDATRVKNWMESSGRNRVASAIHARNRISL